MLHSKYLADDSVDVRTATENVLADFLREIREIAKIKKQQSEEAQARVLANGGVAGGEHARRPLRRRESKTTMESSNAGGSERESWADEEEADGFGKVDGEEYDEDDGEDWQGKGSGSWIPGQGVVVPYAEIVDILLKHVTYPSASPPDTIASPLQTSADDSFTDT
jgi:vacuole morphology and inheritance protein 14